MSNFMSSVSVEESIDKVVAFTGDDGHLRRFVADLEGGAPAGEVKEWTRIGDRHRHRVEWESGGARGWLEANRRGLVTVMTAEIQPDESATGMDARLDAALLALKEAIEAVDADDIRAAEACPSLVVETVLKGLIRAIPSPQRAPMRAYLDRAPQLDGSEPLEMRRGELCVKWAKGLAEAKAGLARLAAELAEDVKHVEDLASSGFRKGLNEAFDALSEAHRVAAHEGWDAVPWAALLDDLFGA